MEDTTRTGSARNNIRPRAMLLVFIVLILLDFGVAVFIIDPLSTPARIGVSFLIILTVFSSIFIYSFCVSRNYVIEILALLVFLSGAFVIAIILWFVFPDNARFEPLTTLLGLLLGLLGFLSSSSGAGIITLKFERADGNSTRIYVQLDNADTPAPSPDDVD